MSVRSFNFYCILVYLYCLYISVMLWYVSGLWSFTTNKQQTYFRRLPNSMANLRANISGDKHDIDNRASALAIVRVSYIASKRHELWSANDFRLDRYFLPTLCKFCVFRNFTATIYTGQYLRNETRYTPDNWVSALESTRVSYIGSKYQRTLLH